MTKMVDPVVIDPFIKVAMFFTAVSIFTTFLCGITLFIAGQKLHRSSNKNWADEDPWYSPQNAPRYYMAVAAILSAIGGYLVFAPLSPLFNVVCGLIAVLIAPCFSINGTILGTLVTSGKKIEPYLKPPWEKIEWIHHDTPLSAENNAQRLAQKYADRYPRYRPSISRMIRAAKIFLGNNCKSKHPLWGMF